MPKIDVARNLRKKATDAETRLWWQLRNRQLGRFKFRRQHRIGKFVVDFVCLEHKLVVEIDGGQHADAIDYDETRTVFLTSLGYRVVRFWNNDVFTNTEDVLREILRMLGDTPSPQPSPRVRGEGDAGQADS